MRRVTVVNACTSTLSGGGYPMGNGNGQERTHWVGVDLGGTKILALVFDQSFEIVGRERKKTKAYEGAESGLGRIEKTIRGALEQASVDVEQLAGIG
ncbi:MAG: hypothetical protein GF331_10935, partial [Chitinivibrionales bacterium]|nr:hypothetical protein [Chitinivibrionales bacterium]